MWELGCKIDITGLVLQCNADNILPLLCFCLLPAALNTFVVIAWLQLPDCTPLPAPLALRTVAPAVVPSPQRAAGPATLDMSPSGAQRSWQQQQQGQMQQQQQQLQLLHQQHHRRPRVGEAPPRPAINITAVYPSITPTIAPQPGSPSALQRQQEPQQWATTQQGMPGKGLVRAPCTRI